MDDEYLEEIAEFAKTKLIGVYGFCGEAKCDDVTMLNSNDNDGNDIIITIKSRPE